MTRLYKTLLAGAAIAVLSASSAMAQDGTACGYDNNGIFGSSFDCWNVNIAQNRIHWDELTPQLRNRITQIRNRSIHNWNINWAQQAQLDDHHVWIHTNHYQIDAFQATRGDGSDSWSWDAAAVGNHSTAAGVNAIVGVVTHACGAGSLSGGACYDPDQFEADGVTLISGAVPNGSIYIDHIDPVDNGTALGANTLVSHDHSTALGADAVSTDDHQVTLGTSEDTISAPGITSQLSKDRQTGPIEIVTSDSEGRLATDGGATHTAIQGNALAIGQNKAKNVEQDGRLNNHNNRINHNYGLIQDNAADIGVNSLAIGDNRSAIQDNRSAIENNTTRLGQVEKGLAISNALPDTWLSDNEDFALAASFGFAGDETAVGASTIVRVDHNWSLNGKFGADTSFEEYGGSVGARFGF